MLVFVPGRVRGRAEFRLRLRAVFPGRFSVAPLRLEGMYDPELVLTANTASVVEVAPR